MNLSLESLWRQLASPRGIKVLLGLLILLLVRPIVHRLFLWARSSGSRYHHLLPGLEQVVLYIGWLVISLWTLAQCGVDIKVPLAAGGVFAGILGTGLAFASQTSVSQLISGGFLRLENAFVPGDVVQMDNMIGEILSIDLMSTKLRTLDNLLVRIPNDAVLKGTISNLTRLPLRRIDVEFWVTTSADVSQLEQQILAEVHNQPLVLLDPAPLLFVLGVVEGNFRIQLSVWAERIHFAAVRNGTYSTIARALHHMQLTFGQPSRAMRIVEQQQLMAGAFPSLPPSGSLRSDASSR